MTCVLVNTACKNAFSCFFLLFWVVDVYIALHISFLPLRRARVTFDTSETQKVFGPIVIDYHQVCTISLHLLFGLETENSFRSRTGCIYMVLTLVKVCLTFLKLSVYHEVTNIFSLDSRFNLKLT